jgi:hypothetical protein
MSAQKPAAVKKPLTKNMKQQMLPDKEPTEPVPQLRMLAVGVSDIRAKKNPNLSEFLAKVAVKSQELSDYIQEQSKAHSVHVTLETIVTFHW